MPTKNQIRDALLAFYAGSASPISRAAADKLAQKIKRNRFVTPEFVKVLAHDDPTGEQAVNNILRSLGINIRTGVQMA
ncbi:hypothetical protein ACN08Y_10450 [Rothia sp. P5764]|uniref:hypothetical protein n=1 Tax=Rothia sp. P5764 TaxID=3402654 RepID=UPI003AD02181